MKSRVVRVILLLLVAAAFGGAAYNIALLERQIGGVQAGERRFSEQTSRTTSVVAELKAAQYAYAAPGQAASFWTERAGKLLGVLASDVKRLQRDATSAEARAQVGSALEALENCAQIDRTVQAYVAEGRTLLGADLAFADARQANETLASRLDAARWSERSAAAASLDVARRTELATAAGAGIFALLVITLLAFTGPSRRSEVVEPAATDMLTIRDAAPASSFSREAAAPAPAPEPQPWPPADLSVAAALCTDFARLRENKQLPALLERFAHLIDAAGIVVWIADANGHELRAAVGYGYPTQALARMRGIAKDADNVTASAYRDGRLQVIDREGDGNGAIAVPLPTPDGCVGVMAAEVRGGAERRPNTQALATIVAAQIATLVAPQS